MAELADALDSGSSGHCARAGSSPVIRSNAEKTIDRLSVVFLFFPIMGDTKDDFLLAKIFKKLQKSVDKFRSVRYYNLAH